MQYQVVSEVPNRKHWLNTSKQDDVIPPEITLKYLKLPVNTDPRIGARKTNYSARNFDYR